MFIYQVRFGNGCQSQIRASSPRQAYELASKIGIVAHIKFLR